MTKLYKLMKYYKSHLMNRKQKSHKKKKIKLKRTIQMKMIINHQKSNQKDQLKIFFNEFLMKIKLQSFCFKLLNRIISLLEFGYLKKLLNLMKNYQRILIKENMKYQDLLATAIITNSFQISLNQYLKNIIYLKQMRILRFYKIIFNI